MRKTLEVVVWILSVCSYIGGLMFFTMCIGALFSGQVVIGARP